MNQYSKAYVQIIWLQSISIEKKMHFTEGNTYFIFMSWQTQGMNDHIEVYILSMAITVFDDIRSMPHLYLLLL